MSTWRSQIIVDSYLSGRRLHKFWKARESRSRWMQHQKREPIPLLCSFKLMNSTSFTLHFDIFCPASISLFIISPKERIWFRKLKCKNFLTPISAIFLCAILHQSQHSKTQIPRKRSFSKNSFPFALPSISVHNPQWRLSSPLRLSAPFTFPSNTNTSVVSGVCLPCSLITPHQPLQRFPNPVSPASQHHPIPIPRQAKPRSNVPRRNCCDCLRIASCTTLDLHGEWIYRMASGAASSTPHSVNNDQATIYKRVEVNGDAELSPVWIGYI